MSKVIVHPLVLGSGRRLFPEGGAATMLRLVKTSTTTTGVVIVTYQPAEPVSRRNTDTATQ